MCDQYTSLLDGTASMEVDSFIKSVDVERYPLPPTLHPYSLSSLPPSLNQRINKFRALSRELSVLRRRVYLNFVLLDCSDVNLMLAKRAADLSERLVSFVVAQNRELNKE